MNKFEACSFRPGYEVRRMPVPMRREPLQIPESGSSDGITLHFVCYCEPRRAAIEGIASNRDNGSCLDWLSSSDMALVRMNERPRLGRSIMVSCAEVANLHVGKNRTTTNRFFDGKPSSFKTHEPSCCCCCCFCQLLLAATGVDGFGWLLLLPVVGCWCPCWLLLAGFAA